LPHITYRPARASESRALTDLARAAKAHWGYSDELMALWADDLGVSSAFITHNHVVCAECDGDLVGFAAVCEEDGAYELEHLWVHPTRMRQGVGSGLLAQAVTYLRAVGARQVRIVSDPHAEGFYLRLGARRIGQKESTKRPGRFLPVLVLDVGEEVAP